MWDLPNYWDNISSFKKYRRNENNYGNNFDSKKITNTYHTNIIGLTDPLPKFPNRYLYREIINIEFSDGDQLTQQNEIKNIIRAHKKKIVMKNSL